MTYQSHQEESITGPTLKLITLGRKTGLPHVVETRFVYCEGSYFLLAGRARSDWALNALAAGMVRVRQGELVYEVSARPASTAEKAQARDLFARKYGQKLMDDWYSGAEVCLKLSQASPPSRRGGIRGETATSTTFAEWRNRNRDYYSGVAEAFDSASEEYDHTINGNFINKWIRDRSIRELLTLVRHDDVLLEIGCGTGAEAVRVSRRVSKVVATDISSMMISLLRRKIEAMRLEDRVVALQLGATEVSGAAEYLPRGKTRVAFSFNGALNCEPNLDSFPDELAGVVEDGGYFVCSIRNSLCLSEAMAHAAVLQFSKMAPRKKQPIMVSVGGMDIPSYYYRPTKFAEKFAHRFVIKRMIGLPSILPPAYLSDVYFKARRVLSFAERAEESMAGRFPLNRFGDQTLFVFQKKEGTRP
jgi:ubiquinone/menaquinone biosynthesis C-methylase UbiE